MSKVTVNGKCALLLGEGMRLLPQLQTMGTSTCFSSSARTPLVVSPLKL